VEVPVAEPYLWTAAIEPPYWLHNVLITGNVETLNTICEDHKVSVRTHSGEAPKTEEHLVKRVTQNKKTSFLIFL
jgi:hypothetical protein